MQCGYSITVQQKVNVRTEMNIHSMKEIRHYDSLLLAMLIFSPKLYVIVCMMNISLVRLSAMHASELVCVLCSEDTFSFVQLLSWRIWIHSSATELSLYCDSLLVPWDCNFSSLLTVRHSMDKFGYLNKHQVLEGEDGLGLGFHSRPFSELIVISTVTIRCTKQSGPYLYCCLTLASGHWLWLHHHWFVVESPSTQ